MGMYANAPAARVAKDQKKQALKFQKKDDKNDLSERKMTVHERALLKEAKMKELQSFFENGVWEFQTTAEATTERTLTSRMILKWSKNSDGSPRAKARLVVRGYSDIDALEGNLETSSPTTSRLWAGQLGQLMWQLRSCRACRKTANCG